MLNCCVVLRHLAKTEALRLSAVEGSGSATEQIRNTVEHRKRIWWKLVVLFSVKGADNKFAVSSWWSRAANMTQNLLNWTWKKNKLLVRKLTKKLNWRSSYRDANMQTPSSKEKQSRLENEPRVMNLFVKLFRVRVEPEVLWLWCSVTCYESRPCIWDRSRWKQ